MTVDDKWLGTSAAGRRLGVSAETVRKMIVAGELVATRTQLGHLVHPEEVERVRGARQKAQVNAALAYLAS